MGNNVCIGFDSSDLAASVVRSVLTKGAVAYQNYRKGNEQATSGGLPLASTFGSVLASRPNGVFYVLVLGYLSWIVPCAILFILGALSNDL